MRVLTRYAFQAPLPSGNPPGVEPAAVHAHIDRWLEFKGTLAEDGRSVALRNGHLAKVYRSDVTSSHGTIRELVLIEPTPGGFFRTGVSVAESADLVAVSIGLGAGSSTLSPLTLDVHCPRLVKDLLAAPSPWTYNGTPLTSAALEFSGIPGGNNFVALAWDQNRSVPIVAISHEYGAVLHAGIVEALAADLAGLAIVGRLDPEASWRITARKGKEWSCYGGAIRLYWPGIDARPSPYQHPLWTARRLLVGVADTETAAGRIRSQLRRRIMGQSAFAITESALFAQIRRAARHEELSALRSKATEGADYKELANEYFNELVKANEQIEKRDQQIEELNARVSSLQLALQWKDQVSDAIEPDSDTPPATVEEAVLIAMERCEDSLVFGAEVDHGIHALAKDAGPPDKVLTYLLTLAELTQARAKGSLGTAPVMWLGERGVIASTESETIRNSPKEMQARAWDDGFGQKRFFDFHLKPSDATSPDRCVRIYFEYDERLQKTIIGWVGPHP